MCGAFQSIGFTHVQITHRFDPFAATTKERTARKYGVIGANVMATKP